MGTVVPAESTEYNTCVTECLHLQQSSHLCSRLEKAAVGHHCGVKSLGHLATERMGEQVCSVANTQPPRNNAPRQRRVRSRPSPCGTGDTARPPGRTGAS